MSDLIANEVFMWIQWEDVQYMGFLSFDDLTFRSQIGTLLKANIGRSIEEIGDLDLSSKSEPTPADAYSRAPSSPSGSPPVCKSQS